jgi:phospholipid/cholesterol/gamma-HCH transport system ATP-binding protein
MIKVVDLHKSFDSQRVLQGVDLTVERAEVLALIGRSGYGKSVLLRHMMGLVRPDRGHVFIDGEDIHRLSSPRLKSMKEKFGVLFQGGALFDSLTVFENVAFPLREKSRLKEAEIEETVLHELDQVGLKGSERKYPAEISGGMKKRVALARAIIHNPQIVFFDEPTTGLDPVTTQSIHELIASTHQRLNFTAIIVTHEVPEIFPIIDRVAVLHDGRVQYTGKPEEILNSEDPVVRSFFLMRAEQDQRIKGAKE